VKWLNTLSRIIDGALNAYNRKKKRDAANDAANTIANGGSVRESEQSFSDLASKSKRDQSE
jgi:hypothetical protein